MPRPVATLSVVLLERPTSRPFFFYSRVHFDILRIMEKTAAELDNAKNFITHYYFVYGNKVLGAVIILLAGGLVARWVGKLMQRWLDGKQLEPPVKTLIVRVIRLLIFCLTLVIALDEFGVPITTLVAGISVAGVGVGLAMQGVLGNLVA